MTRTEVAQHVSGGVDVVDIAVVARQPKGVARAAGHILDPARIASPVIDAAGEVDRRQRRLAGVVLGNDAVAAAWLNGPGIGAVEGRARRAARPKGSQERAGGAPPFDRALGVVADPQCRSLGAGRECQGQRQRRSAS